MSEPSSGFRIRFRLVDLLVVIVLFVIVDGL